MAPVSTIIQFFELQESKMLTSHNNSPFRVKKKSYIEAWHLVFFDSPIFSEDIKAWQHGPVLKSVWYNFKRYSILYNELEACEECESDLSDEQKDLINDVLDEYGDKTGYYLENLTHEEEP